MKLHTLSEFSKTVMRQTEQSVSYFFWSWLGGCILWMLCRIAFCYAVQISFTFLGLLTALEATWYGVRLLFAVGGFFWLTPLLYRCLYACAAAASLTKQPAPKKGAVYRMALCLRGLRLLVLLPLPLCLWSLRWCLEQGTTVSDGVWWLWTGMQFLTLAVLFLAGWLWLLPVCLAAPVLQVLFPEHRCWSLVCDALTLMEGRRKEWYRLMLRSLPFWLLPHLWSRLAMMQTVYIGVCWVETQAAQRKQKGGMSHVANTHMANGAGTALHTRTISQKRKKRLSATADQVKAYERALVQRNTHPKH